MIIANAHQYISIALSGLGTDFDYDSEPVIRYKLLWLELDYLKQLKYRQSISCQSVFVVQWIGLMDFMPVINFSYLIYS